MIDSSCVQHRRFAVRYERKSPLRSPLRKCARTIHRIGDATQINADL
ncbi:MAG TPA: hypothetical protein VH012_06065 [Acidimicrobiales bacterium]|nr:hypothetical protein [Acidimicrobiales bacterium]